MKKTQLANIVFDTLTKPRYSDLWIISMGLTLVVLSKVLPSMFAACLAYGVYMLTLGTLLAGFNHLFVVFVLLRKRKISREDKPDTF